VNVRPSGLAAHRGGKLHDVGIDISEAEHECGGLVRHDVDSIVRDPFGGSSFRGETYNATGQPAMS
jgi:hypothetical protein